MLLLAAGLVAAGAAWFWAFAGPVTLEGDTFVTVAPGSPARTIALQLERAGVIRTRWAFDAERFLLGGSLKAGMYRFTGSRTVKQVYGQIARGEVYTLTLVVPEGSNLFDIAQRVQAAKLGSSEGFLEAARQNVALVKGIDPQAGSLEGYLFPDTYRFAPNVKAAGILAAMVRRFQVEAAALGVGGDVHRLVTLASLVEKETPLGSERPLVASVFENRLAKGMALDTDPSVIYAALLEGRYRGTIFQSDLNRDSAYNTYRHNGLPPGPICNPGAASLTAAMHPPRTKYLYFVAAGADPQGSSRFAETIEEHDRNVAEYRKSLHSQGGR